MVSVLGRLLLDGAPPHAISHISGGVPMQWCPSLVFRQMPQVSADAGDRKFSLHAALI
jgi:hypothetical protein